MRSHRNPSLAKTCLVVAALLIAAGPSYAQVKIGVITSSSGPIATIGIVQRNTVGLLPKEIGGQSVEYVSLDDASDPTATVSAVKKLIGETKVDAIIGPSGSPNAVNVIQFVAEAGVPMLAPVGSAAVVLPMNDKKKWVFKITPNDDVNARVLIDHMKATGVKTLGYIGTADPFGENWLKVVSAMAQDAGIKVVSSESFQRSDTSVTAQILKTTMDKPDAVLIAAPGSSALLPETTLIDQRYKGKIYQTMGAAFDEFLKNGGKKVEGTLIAAIAFLALDDVPESDPTKALSQQYSAGYQKLNGSKPSIFGTEVYDAGLMLQAAVPVALEKGQPGTPAFRSALRDAIEALKDMKGTQGVYTMTPQDHSGLDQRSMLMFTVKNGQWALLK